MMFTAPTAMRAIRAADPEGLFKKKYDTSSLEIFFIAGERSDPPTVKWCQDVLQVPVIDNYWQTETAAPISTAPRCEVTCFPKVVVGSGGVAAPGWDLACLPSSNNENGNEEINNNNNNKTGDIVGKFPLPPGVFSSLWKRPGDLMKIYCREHNNEFYYSTFDSGIIDDGGHLHIMSRVDDVINVAAHRLSTGQLEQAIATHDSAAESAVVGKPDKLKGTRPVAFVVLKGNQFEEIRKLENSNEVLGKLEKDLNEQLRKHVGAIAASDIIVVSKLPKTRSGKVLRRLLREMVAGVEREKLTVAPTIEDFGNVDVLFESVQQHMKK